MQIVIDIDDNEYMTIKEYPNNITSYPITIHVYDAIRNGVPFPKGHGRLIDADQLMNYCQNQIDGHKYADCNVIARFPTVLNAEEESDKTKNLSFCGTKMGLEVKENGSK